MLTRKPAATPERHAAPPHFLILGISLFVLCSALHAAPSYTWKNVTIVGGGFVDGIVFHPTQPNLIYARTDIGGAYRWDNNASQWVPLLDWVASNNWNTYGVESIGLDPQDPNKLYLACGTYTNSWAGDAAFLLSSDQGKTFQQVYVPFKMGGNEDGRFSGERLAVDPNKGSVLYFGSRHNGLWVSTDSGMTWNPSATFPFAGDSGVGITFVRFVPTSGVNGSPTPTIIAGVDSATANLYRSDDAGKTWKAVSGQPSNLIPYHGEAASNGWLYVTFGDQPGPNNLSTGAAYKYNIGDGVWVNITPPTGQGGFAGVSVDAENPDKVVVSTLDRWYPGDTVYRSDNGGATWTDLGAQAVHDPTLSPWVTFGAATAGFTAWGNWIGYIQIDPFNSNHALYGTGQTIWSSEDLGGADSGQPTHWTVGAVGLEETSIGMLVSPPSGANLHSAMGDIGGFRHDDFGHSPPAGMSNNPIHGSTTAVDFAELNPNVMARVGWGNNVYGVLSLDGGTSWTPFASAPPGATGAGMVAVSADGNTFVWSLQNGSPPLTQTTFYSTNQGTTWTPSAGAPAAAGNFNAIIADRVNPNKFYLFSAGTGQIYVSANGGQSFSGGTFLPVYRDYPRAVPGIEGDIWLAGNGSGLYHSTNSGATFTAVPTVQQAYSIGFGMPPAVSSYPALYLSGQVNGLAAIYRSDDQGATWIRINDDQHQYAVPAIAIGDPRVYGRVYLGSNGRGILYGDLVASLKVISLGQPGCQTCQVIVQASASDGSPVPGVTVNFTVTNGTAGSGWAVTDAQGQAAVTVNPQTVGQILLQASVAGLPQAATLLNANAASYQIGAFAPGSFAIAVGTSLAATVASAGTNPCPTNLAGTQVSVTDSGGATYPAEVCFVSPGQIDYVVPSQTALGLATVNVTAGDGSTSSGPANVSATGPGLFFYPGTNLAAAFVLTYQGTTLESVGNDWQLGANNSLVPAPIDLSAGQVYLSLYGTGIHGYQSISVTVGGKSVPPSYAGFPGQYPGLDQINLLLPADLAGAGDVTIQVTVDGQPANPVHVTIR